MCRFENTGNWTFLLIYSKIKYIKPERKSNHGYI